MIHFQSEYFRFPRNYRAGFIYLFQRKPDNLIKVGLTDNIERRLRELERVYGRLVYVHTIEASDTLWAEQWIHMCLKNCRVEGEWFDIPAEARSILFAMSRIDPPESDAGTQERPPVLRRWGGRQ